MLLSLVLVVAIFADSPFIVSCQTLAESNSLQEQQTHSCYLKDNRTAAAHFFGSVRAQHGVSNGIPLRALAVVKGGSIGHKCFSQLECPGASATWCFNLYNPTRPIEICWDSDNSILNMTDQAALLGLDRYFTIGYDCSGTTGPCIAVHSTPFYFDGGILTCTSHTVTCTAKSFSKVTVVFSPAVVRSPEIIFHNSTSEMVVGQQNVYFFTAEIPSASYLSFGGFREGTNPVGVYAYDNQTFLNFIPEYPFCDATNCREIDRASADYNELKEQRIRVYSYFSFVANCPEDIFRFYTWLVIDNAQESDADTDYIFRVSVPVSLFPPREASREKLLNLTAVAPINITTLQVPLISGSTDTSTFVNGSTVLALGESVEWSVTAQAGTGDRLVWTHNGKQLPAVTAAQNHNKDFLCSQYNIYYTYSAQEVSQFVKNFTSSLYLCNFSRPIHIGHYECQVLRSWGNHGPTILWSTTVAASVTRQPMTLNSTTEQSETTDDVKVSVEPFTTIYIAVGVFISVLLVTVLLMLVCMLVCIRRAQRRRLYKSRRPSRKSDIVIQAFPNRPQVDSAWGRSISRCSSTDHDELEFPREKLVFLDKVLGNGTFGIVLLAKAEGIVGHSPERNIVAIKTHKPSAPSSETDCLWQELQIMQGIEPHPHIVNLLGYTRETTNSPLYLIVEFALHGSLQTYLQDCEEVVLRLHHRVCVVHRDGTSTADTSPYTNMSDLSPTEPSSPTTPSSEASVFFAAASNSMSGSELNVRPSSELQQDRGDGDFFDSKISARVSFDESPAAVSRDYINSKGLLYMEDVQAFALQIASGLKHLEEQNIVHCDLAARNILISEGFVLKIGDFGMAKEMSEKEYYRRSEGQIPVKWTAPEALEEHIFSHKSDIWSYAVILWEIFSYGHRPYSDVKIGQSWDPFIRSLQAGTRLAQPDGCPDPFYKVMQHCWQLDPAARPSASDLVRLFETCSDLSSDHHVATDLSSDHHVATDLSSDHHVAIDLSGDHHVVPDTVSTEDTVKSEDTV